MDIDSAILILRYWQQFGAIAIWATFVRITWSRS